MSKIIGRRLFSKGVVGLPTALRMPPPGPPALDSGYGIVGVGMPPEPPAARSLVSMIWKALRTQTKDSSERQQLRYMRRTMMGGLDPDLAVLNSMSLTRRVDIQIEREKAIEERHRSLRAQIVRSMGGNPEDYE